MKELDDIDPDGVLICIHWDNFSEGSSFFFPCINTTKALAQIKKIADRKSMKVKGKESVENGMYGLRVWRLE